FKAMSARTGVYAEPSLLDAAAAEFADTEQMLKISEGLFGAYRWGRYDLLILPPSFPFGGMENPRLSFITPTVIAGDKSLVSLIAHELAHSWSGNLVTNATWRDLWLNEGFTSYLTARIMEAVYGEPRRAMEAVLDYASLLRELDTLPAGDQILAIDLRGRDPDDVFSSVPYTKGQMFLEWLEAKLGRERFDDFLRRYFDHFAFKSITTDDFLAYAQEQLIADSDGVTRAAVDAWVFEPGLPADAVLPESDAFEKVGAQFDAWWRGELKAAELDTAAWTVHEWLYFLNNLPHDIHTARLGELDEAFALTASTNNEIAHSWLLVSIRSNYAPAQPRLEQYLIAIGRRKLIRPLYEALMATPEGAAVARRVYAQARPGYHPLAQSTMDRIVDGG
ncbi:MAG: leukotriene A4 hydrolase C-terminal domain-containing protein, partial [Pseudomonadota bacterium]